MNVGLLSLNTQQSLPKCFGAIVLNGHGLFLAKKLLFALSKILFAVV